MKLAVDMVRVLTHTSVSMPSDRAQPTDTHRASSCLGGRVQLLGRGAGKGTTTRITKFWIHLAT